MLALFSTVFILFGAPALLLYAGRLIRSTTDNIHRRAAPASVMTGDEWFCRAPGSAMREPPRSDVAIDADEQWFFRPMPPIVVWPDMRPFLQRLLRPWRRRGSAARVQGASL